MTGRERLEAFWSGQRPDRVPCTLDGHHWLAANGGEDDPADWLPLFDQGLLLVQRVSAVSQLLDDSDQRWETVDDPAGPLTRVRHTTSRGTLTATWQEGRPREYWLKTPDDVAIMSHIVRNTWLEAEPSAWAEATVAAATQPWRVPVLAFGRSPEAALRHDLCGPEHYPTLAATCPGPLAELRELLWERALERARLLATVPGTLVVLDTGDGADRPEAGDAERREAEGAEGALAPGYQQLADCLRAVEGPAGPRQVLGLRHTGRLPAATAALAAAPEAVHLGLAITLADVPRLAPLRVAWPTARLSLRLNPTFATAPPATLAAVAAVGPLACELDDLLTPTTAAALPGLLAALGG